jgi:hypothetical protein
VRYYDIKITNPKTGAVVKPKSLAGTPGDTTFTSYVNGKTIGGALNVEIQISTYGYATPRQGSWIRIWGIAIDELSDASNLNGMNIVVKAGMQKGLPLAKPQQNGVIMQGKIFQAFGNWEGTNQTLDIIVMPDVGDSASPKNFSFNWKAKTKLTDAIKITLQSAMPEYETKIAISDSLVLNNNEYAVFAKLDDFSRFIKNITTQKKFQGIKPLSGGTYYGVDIVIKEKTIVVSDGTSKSTGSTYDSPTQINFEDMIGQPTWLSPITLSFKCVMRADIKVGDYVKLPSQLSSPFALTTAGAARDNVPARNKSAFKGKFVIKELYHFGNFRQPTADAWTTAFEAAFNSEPPPGGQEQPVPAESQTSPGSGNASVLEQAFNAPTGTIISNTAYGPPGPAQVTGGDLISQAFVAPTGTTVTDPKIVSAFNAPG